MLLCSRYILNILYLKEIYLFIFFFFFCNTIYREHNMIFAVIKPDSLLYGWWIKGFAEEQKAGSLGFPCHSSYHGAAWCEIYLLSSAV